MDSKKSNSAVTIGHQSRDATYVALFFSFLAYLSLLTCHYAPWLFAFHVLPHAFFYPLTFVARHIAYFIPVPSAFPLSNLA